MEDTLIKKDIYLEGLNCAHCAQVINDKIEKLEEVNSANLNFINKKLTININSDVDYNILSQKIKDIIDKVEPGLNIIFENDFKSDTKISNTTIEEDDTKDEFIKLSIGVAVYLFGIYQSISGKESLFSNIIFIITYFLVGFDILKKSLKNILNGKVLDENFLMSLATIGAIAINEIPEAVGVMLFYKIGEYIQKKAVGKSRKSIASLMDIRPNTANLKVGSKIEVVSPSEVKIGDTIIVKNGEKVPLDGVVIDGRSMVDTSCLTGESVFRGVSIGDEVLSGFINKNSTLTIKVSKEFEDSTVSKILDLVENASSKKSKTENFITKFARYYTPIVVLLSILITFITPILTDKSLSESFYNGLVFLVVSCPCALVLSIPLTYFSGIGVASKNGILIKGSNYLELLRNIDTVIFDKTGTLTEGVFDVSKIKGINITEEELLKYCAFAEVNSNHPIAKSILKAYDKEIDIEKIISYEEIDSYGVKVNYDNNNILVGNEKLLKKENILFTKPNEFGTIVYVAVNQVYKGYIVISDKIKAESEEALKSIKNMNIDTIMLTGDNEEVAKNVSKKLKIDKYYANLLPIDKVNRLEEIIKDNKKVAFVGDGINDAPVLKRADIGISMGGIGSDCAIEASDIVIMNDDISKIKKGIEISEKTYKIVWQNIIFVLSIKLVVMILGAGGVASMWEAIFADVGVSILAVLNSMRIMKA